MEEYIFHGIISAEETHWWYCARRELILRYIAGGKVLEIGCGTGNILLGIAKRCEEAIGVDPSLIAVKMSRNRVRQAGLENVRLARADGLKLCFPDDSFGMVVCADVVEHLDDEYAFLSEVKRVLKPRGKALITAPASKRLWSRLDDEAGHRRRYDIQILRSLLSDLGFAEIRIRYWNSILFPVILLYRKLLNPGFARELAVGAPKQAINRLLYQLLKLEERIILPFGASLLAVVRKV